MEKNMKRMMYYDLIFWNKIEKTEDTQEVYALFQEFCKKNSINIVSYRVREASMPQPQEEQEE